VEKDNNEKNKKLFNVGENNNLNLINSLKLDSSVNKQMQINSNNNYHPPQLTQTGDKLKLLKYSVNDVKQKKNKLSRKQRRLQEGENTLASFLSREDKSFFTSNKNEESLRRNSSKINQNSSSFGYSDSNKIILSSNNNTGMGLNPGEKSSNNLINNSLNNLSSINNTSSNVILIPRGHSNNDILGNNKNLEMLGKKKKRISKFKKAVYKYRFQKKQFIFNKLFNLIEKDNNNNQIISENIENELKFNSDNKIEANILPSGPAQNKNNLSV